MPDRNPGKGSVVKCIIISMGEELRRGYPTLITEQCATISIPYYHTAPHSFVFTLSGQKKVWRNIQAPSSRR